MAVDVEATSRMLSARPKKRRLLERRKSEQGIGEKSMFNSQVGNAWWLPAPKMGLESEQRTERDSRVGKEARCVWYYWRKEPEALATLGISGS